MASVSAIEWTDATWTPIRARQIEIQGDGSGKERVGWHCEHVSEGCRNCYAETFNMRLGTGLAFKPGELYREEKRGYRNGEAKLFLDEHMLAAPLRWKKPRMVFVCSMTDLFADFVPDEWIDQVFAIMALTPQHTYQILTKRPERMRAYLDPYDQRRADALGRIVIEMGYSVPLEALRWPLPNVWLGVSAERQAEADERVPLLLDTPAAIRFVSAEPLLGNIDFTWIAQPDDERDGVIDALAGRDWIDGQGYSGSLQRVWRYPGKVDQVWKRFVGPKRPRLDWIIVGGESGPGARPMHPDWARSIRDQCAAAGIPFFMKQWGRWSPVYDRDAEDPDWRRCDSIARRTPKGRWLNLVGGHGFHGDRVVRVDDVGKKRAGRLLDGRTHDEWPQPTEVPAL